MAQHQYYCEECGKHLFDSEKDGDRRLRSSGIEGKYVVLNV